MGCHKYLSYIINFIDSYLFNIHFSLYAFFTIYIIFEQLCMSIMDIYIKYVFKVLKVII